METLEITPVFFYFIDFTSVYLSAELVMILSSPFRYGFSFTMIVSTNCRFHVVTFDLFAIYDEILSAVSL